MAIYDNPDDWFNGTARKTKKSSGSGGGFTKPTNRIASSPKAIKAKTLKAVAAINNKKIPQVMVKISGASKGMDKAQAHANYIGRHGKVELEDETGHKFTGKDEQKDLLKSWGAMGLHDKDETGTRKEAFHFVFSMPKGTNPDALKSAVKNLVQEEFTGHKYYLAQHLDTDSPHVHVIVAAADDRGARLNPRKADLHNYRVQFAQKLIEQGVEATASRRVHRFKYQEGKAQGLIHKEQRTGQGQYKPSPTPEQNRRIQATHKDIAGKLKQYADLLPESEIQLKNEVNKLIKTNIKDKGKGR